MEKQGTIYKYKKWFNKLPWSIISMLFLFLFLLMFDLFFMFCSFAFISLQTRSHFRENIELLGWWIWSGTSFWRKKRRSFTSRWIENIFHNKSDQTGKKKIKDISKEIFSKEFFIIADYLEWERAIRKYSNCASFRPFFDIRKQETFMHHEILCFL